MTGRWFYTDPLAAAWMAKHFGMHFTDIDQLEVFPLNWTSPLLHGVRMYVHPDSLHLLEPQVGDMISHLGMRAWRIDATDGYAYFHPKMPNESIDRFTLKADMPKIIQRNGIPFMTPEME